MTDRETIKKEIERLKAKQLAIFSKGESEESCGDALTHIGAYNQLLSFIDSLPEESVSEEFETEIEKYFNALYRNWTKKDREKDTDVEEMCRQTARHFAEWQKNKMMEDAIETSVMAAFAIGLHIEVKLDSNKYRFGDKVKLIIIKENNK